MLPMLLSRCRTYTHTYYAPSCRNRTAPADMDDPHVAAALLRFAELYCDSGHVGVDAIAGPAWGRAQVPHEPPRSEVGHLGAAGPGANRERGMDLPECILRMTMAWELEVGGTDVA